MPPSLCAGDESMKNRRVGICHQTVSYGDAIGNDIVGMHDLLSAIGLKPTILCEYINGDIGHRDVRTAVEVNEINEYGIVIYHHSIYWEKGETMLNTYSGT